jgi:hypothetical protein
VKAAVVAEAVAAMAAPEVAAATAEAVAAVVTAAVAVAAEVAAAEVVVAADAMADAVAAAEVAGKSGKGAGNGSLFSLSMAAYQGLGWVVEGGVG